MFHFVTFFKSLVLLTTITSGSILPKIHEEVETSPNFGVWNLSKLSSLHGKTPSVHHILTNISSIAPSVLVRKQIVKSVTRRSFKIPFHFLQSRGSSFVKSCPICCHCSTNFLYIQDSSSPIPLAVYPDVKWIISYRKSLAKSLQRAGFNLYDGPGTSCEWREIGDVEKGGVSRGSMEYHGWERPSDELMTKLRIVLESTYPAAEIATIVLCVLVPCVLFFSVCVAIWIVERRRRKLGRECQF
jgi:hypothetical protein